MSDTTEPLGQTASSLRCFTAIISSIVCFFAILVIGGITSPHSSLVWKYLGLANFSITSIVLATIVPGINTFKRPDSQLVGVTIFTVLCLICISWYIPPEQNFVNELKSNSSANRTVLILIICIAAPIIEEIYFRGLLFPIASLNLGTRLGALLSAFLFILGHLSLGVVFVTAVYTWLVYRYRSIYPSIFAHIAYNSGLVIHVIMSPK